MECVICLDSLALADRKAGFWLANCCCGNGDYVAVAVVVVAAGAVVDDDKGNLLKCPSDQCFRRRHRYACSSGGTITVAIEETFVWLSTWALMSLERVHDAVHDFGRFDDGHGFFKFQGKDFEGFPERRLELLGSKPSGLELRDSLPALNEP